MQNRNCKKRCKCDHTGAALPDQAAIVSVMCKGRKDGKPCRHLLYRSDGEKIFIRLASGRDLEITPKKEMSIKCECGYDNHFRVNGRMEMKI